jgi:hypothetical protein
VQAAGPALDSPPGCPLGNSGLAVAQLRGFPNHVAFSGGCNRCGGGLAEGLDPPGPDSNRPQPALRSAGLAPDTPPDAPCPARCSPSPDGSGRRSLPRAVSASPLLPVRVQPSQIEKAPMRGPFQSGAADRIRTGDTWNHKKGIETRRVSVHAGLRGDHGGHPTDTPQPTGFQPCPQPSASPPRRRSWAGPEA